MLVKFASIRSVSDALVCSDNIRVIVLTRYQIYYGANQSPTPPALEN